MPQRSDLNLDLADVDARVEKGALKGLAVALEHLLQVSRDQVPHEEGTLERSGTVDVDAEESRGSVSYDTPYAVIQHENLDFAHDAGRKAKYLEDPLNEESGQMQALIAAQIRRALR